MTKVSAQGFEALRSSVRGVPFFLDFKRRVCSAQVIGTTCAGFWFDSREVLKPHGLKQNILLSRS